MPARSLQDFCENKSCTWLYAGPGLRNRVPLLRVCCFVVIKLTIHFSWKFSGRMQLADLLILVARGLRILQDFAGIC